MLDQLLEERTFEREKAFFEAAQRAADQRAGLIAAMTLNAQRSDEHQKVFAPADFFPYLASRPDAAPTDAVSAEMTTEETVRYLRRGFGGIRDRMLANTRR